MRRKERQQDREVALRIIAEAEYGVLSMVDHQGKPYALPVSHAVVNDTIYIHGALEGKKLDLIPSQSRVAFTCVGKTHLRPALFTTDYESAIAYGRIAIVSDSQVKRSALQAIAKKYSGEFLVEADEYITSAFDEVTVIAITIEEVTAKARRP
ncbi:MAG: pyridoxamine 5'-phosphate oxidase family protein [Sphaerochaeta sp.]